MEPNCPDRLDEPRGERSKCTTSSKDLMLLGFPQVDPMSINMDRKEALVYFQAASQTGSRMVSYKVNDVGRKPR